MIWGTHLWIPYLPRGTPSMGPPSIPSPSTEEHMEGRRQPSDANGTSEKTLRPLVRNLFHPMNLGRTNPENRQNEARELSQPEIIDEASSLDLQENEYLDGPLAEVVQDYLAFVEGRQPNAPSLDHLSVQDRCEAEEMLDLLIAFREESEWDPPAGLEADDQEHPSSLTASRPASASLNTVSQRSASWEVLDNSRMSSPAVQSSVLVSYHSHHRGWANFVILVIEAAGYPCVAKPADREPAESFVRWANMPVVLILSAASTAELELLRTASSQYYNNPLMPKIIPVVVDDPRPNILSAIDHVSFVGANETAARRALLSRVTGQEEALNEQIYTSALQLLLQRMVREDQATAELVERLASTSTLEIVYRYHDLIEGDADQDDTVTSSDLKQAVSILRRRLKKKDRTKCVEVACDLAALAEVRLRLGNVNDAAKDLLQAKTFLQIGQSGRKGKGESGNAVIERSCEELRRQEPELASRFSLC
jgi:hypothetical protein